MTEEEKGGSHPVQTEEWTHIQTFIRPYTSTNAHRCHVARSSARIQKVGSHKERGQPTAPFNRVESRWCHSTVDARQ